MKISKKYWFTDFINNFPLIGNLFYFLIKGKKEVGPFNGIYTMLSLRERLLLFKLAKEYSKVGKILEIGAYAGGSTYFLAKGASINNSQVISIDPFRLNIKDQKNKGDKTSYTKKLNNKPSKQGVELSLLKKGINKNSFVLIEGFSKDIAKNWKENNVSLLWIDGNHLEAYKDFELWKKNLTNGAIVAFHDSNYPVCGKKEVTSDVNKILKEKLGKIIIKLDSITVIKVN